MRIFKPVGWRIAEPQLIEGDIFKMIIPVTPKVTEQATEQDEKIRKILKFCETEKSANQIMDFLKLSHREHFRAEILKPLLEQGLLHPTIPDKLTSPKQKYYSGKQKDKK